MKACFLGLSNMKGVKQHNYKIPIKSSGHNYIIPNGQAAN